MKNINRLFIILTIFIFNNQLAATKLSKILNNIDASGVVQYRYENWSNYDKNYLTKENNKTINANRNEFKFDLNIKSKVNKTVTFDAKIGLDEKHTYNEDRTGADYSNADYDPTIDLKNAFFTFGLSSTTIIAGKQNIVSPFVDRVDTIKTGTGIILIHTLNRSVTFGATHFLNTNIGPKVETSVDEKYDTSKITEIFSIIRMGMIDTFLNINDALLYKQPRTLLEDANRASLAIESKFYGFDVKARHSIARLNDTNETKIENKDGSVSKINVGAKFRGYSMNLIHARTSKFNSSRVAIDSDKNSVVHAFLFQAKTSGLENKKDYGLTNGKFSAIKLKVTTSRTIDLGIAYAVVTSDATTNEEDEIEENKANELMLSFDYKMSKNFELSGIHSIYNVKYGETQNEIESPFTRLQAKYTF